MCNSENQSGNSGHILEVEFEETLREDNDVEKAEVEKHVDMEEDYVKSDNIVLERDS